MTYDTGSNVPPADAPGPLPVTTPPPSASVPPPTAVGAPPVVDPSEDILSTPYSTPIPDETLVGTSTATTYTSASSGTGTVTETVTDTASTAKEEAANLGTTAVQAGGEVAATAAEQAQNVAAEAAAQARDLLGQARSEITAQASNSQQRAAGSLRALGDELQAMIEGRGTANGVAGDLARQAAEKAHLVADWLQQREPADVLDEVRYFARRRPGSFLVGAALAGVALGRLTRGAVSAAGSSATASSSGSARTSGTYEPSPRVIDVTAARPVPATTTGAATGQDALGIRNPTAGPLAVDEESFYGPSGAPGGEASLPGTTAAGTGTGARYGTGEDLR